MRIIRQRLLSLLLVLSIFAGLGSALALPVTGVGDVTATVVTQLADRTTLTQNTLQHYTAGLQAERYIEWNAGGQLKPVVVTGDKIFGGSQTVDSAAEKLTAQGFDVAAGMNGDYFTISTGVPFGLTVTNGIIRSSGSELPAVGFLPDGQAFISRPHPKTMLTYSIGGSNRAVTIDHINKARSTNGLFLFTSDFGETTGTTTTGVNVLLQTFGTLNVGGVLNAVVIGVTTDANAVKLSEGMICLSAESAEAMSRISSLTPNTYVTIETTTTDARYLSCDYIIGGYRMLIEGGIISPLEEKTVTRAPRSAIGVKADGTVVYYSVDGRQSTHSAGLGLNELAERLLMLGCVTALELDGGGSTDMVSRMPGDFELTRLGKPSDGTPRKVSTLIMFINDSPKTEIIQQIFVKSGRIAALTGAEIALTDLKVTAIDTNYHPLNAPAGLIWQSANQQIAQVTDTLKAIAPGTTTLSVSAPSAGMQGVIELNVADKPDSIKIVNAQTGKQVTELALAPNEQINLKAVGVLDGVDAPGGVFYWTTADNYATVDASGVLTAGSVAGTSTRLIAGMGDTVTTVNVMVGKAPEILEDFEIAAAKFSVSAVGTGYSRNSNKDFVKLGLFSGKFDYDFSIAADGTASLPFDADIKLEGSPGYLTFWLKGDGSGNTLNVMMKDALGQTIELTATTMNFTDYRQVYVPLVGISNITGIKLVRAPGSLTAGTFYIDHVQASSSNVPHVVAPVITMSLQADGTSLFVKGSAVDYGGAILKKSNISLKMNGSPIPFEFDDKTGVISAQMAIPTEGHRIFTMTAKNSNGYYDQISKEFEQPTVYTLQSFTDIATSWAGKYVELLDRRGALPKTAANFRPNDIITRAEVAAFMSGVLKLDEAAWVDVKLPYEDLADIPEAVLGAVKALYGNGYMTGVGTTSGGRIFSPNSGFTRAEMFGLIGHTIPKGITKNANASSFSDYYTVPSYAVSYVDLLIGMGVVNGADNKLNPSGLVTRAEFATILARIS